MDKKQHWEKVYTTKQPHEVSWTQDVPKTSLHFIHSFNLPETASIIDIGGGDSKLVDHLLDEGFEHITVLDISEQALDRARKRLGTRAGKVKWIVADVNEFTPTGSYNVWHDRAAFHFLTAADEVAHYLDITRKAVNGYMVMGTFSENGPEKCSGLPVKQYDEAQLQQQLSNGFEKLKCIHENHITPFNTSQNFLFCSFKRA